MSCCGQKRRALAFTDSEAEQELMDDETGGSKNAPSTFRYTGDAGLVINGLFGRNVYKFSTAARELMIVPEDVAIMRAHPELTELKSQA